MAQSEHGTITDSMETPTSPKRPPTGISIGSQKRPASRSNAKQATDLLLDENRIGLDLHKPRKKRRYVQIYVERMMTALTTLYSLVFKVHWTHFRHVESKFPKKDKANDMFESFAIVYLSHWLVDLYRVNRKCLEHLDPVAFAERYFIQVATHSTTYDNYLSTLASHIRPTHIINNYADDVYIPVFSQKSTTNEVSFDWRKFTLDFDLFSLVLNILENKKILKMTPLSSDLLGRPSWLFDWSQEQTAFAWFPQEGNFNDEDVTVAYIIGDACTPKLGHADIDEWKYTNATTVNLSSQQLIDSYIRVQPRRWQGSAEMRVAEVQSIHLPNYYEKDEAIFKASNTGPLQLVSDYIKKLDLASSSTTEEETEDTVDTHIVPASPRYALRSQTTTDTVKFHRTRVIDRMYYYQVIKRFDSTTRFTAFKLFIKYD